MSSFLVDLRKQKKATPAFNVSSIDLFRAVFETGHELGVPVFVETSYAESQYLMPEIASAICRELSDFYGVPYTLHLDRGGNDWDWAKRCLDAGYTSIATEFAHVKIEEIIDQTVRYHELIASYGAAHEGALEVVPLRYYEEQKEELRITDPDTAAQFVQATGVDSLVVSIGTQSGALKKVDKIHYEVLTKLNSLLPETPFTLHGGPFLSSDIIAKCIDLGVAKININAENRLSFTKKLKENIETHPKEYAPHLLHTGIKEELKKIVKQKTVEFMKIA